MPLRFIVFVLLGGGPLQTAMDAGTFVGTVKAGKTAVDAAGTQKKLNKPPHGQCRTAPPQSGNCLAAHSVTPIIPTSPAAGCMRNVTRRLRDRRALPWLVDRIYRSLPDAPLL